MEAAWKRFLEDAEITRLAIEINRQGYAVLPNYVSKEDIEQASALALNAVATLGGEYTSFQGSDAVSGTILSELSHAPAFRTLCQQLYEKASGRSAPEVEFYQIFRCLKGATGQQNSYRFHYDSYIVTALLPIIMPEAGARGDLLISLSPRPIRKQYLTNVLDKVLVDNVFAQLRFRHAARNSSPSIQTIRLQPGNMYFFWGYRSVHTNEPCDADKLRATALFHYGDPHENSRTRTLMRRAIEGAKRLRRK